MRKVVTVLCLALVCSAISCQEPDYRTEVTPNAQGGVEVHRVPLDAPSDATIARPEPDSAGRDTASIARHIRALEAQRSAIDRQIAKLKSQLPPSPATNP